MKLGRVQRVRALVADQQAEPLPGPKPCAGVEVGLQAGQRDALLGQIDALGPGRQAAHQRQVAAVAAHHLDDEAAVRRRRPTA